MIKRTAKFSQIPNLDSEFDSIIKQIEDKLKSTISATSNATIFVAITSGGAVTTELKTRTITLPNGETIEVLVK